MNLPKFTLFQAFMTRINHAKTTRPNKTTASSKLVPSSSSSSSTTMAETWSNMSSTIASLMFAWAIICQYSPYEVRTIIEKLKLALKDYLDPYIRISIYESTGSDRIKRSEVFCLVESYLSSITTKDAKRLRADMDSDGGGGGGGGSGSELVLSMDDHQEVTDEYGGAKLIWGMRRAHQSEKLPYYEQGRRLYVLRFHKKHRETVTKRYLYHVIREGKEIRATARQRRLYTNVAGSSRIGYGYGGGGSSPWCHVAFEHPARLETMALDPEKKAEIFEDLVAFSRNKEFYERAGRAWKRGYLLYGPPGTGKSTMVAAMANLLNYDIYDLELTAVKDNTELRRLLIETTSKSIIVIEDIDCSLDLTGQRKKKKTTTTTSSESGLDIQPNNDKDNDKKITKKRVKEEEGASKVTLSGLLNFIDGIWSACGNERLIVFTTNHVDKLDPALIRSGRMDKHIELSYCTFQGFKVLARNYLKVEDHEMFGEIERLVGVVDITPADVAESLVPKSPRDGPDGCLSNLLRALQEAHLAKANRILEKDDEDEIIICNQNE